MATNQEDSLLKRDGRFSFKIESVKAWCLQSLKKCYRKQSGILIKMVGSNWSLEFRVSKSFGKDKNVLQGILVATPEIKVDKWVYHCKIVCELIVHKSDRENKRTEHLPIIANNMRPIFFNITFEELFDPNNGYHNQKEDSATLLINLSVCRCEGIMLPIAETKDTLMVNNTAFKLLASQSDYFETLIYGNNFARGNSINDESVDLEIFEQILKMIHYPGAANVFLTDYNIERIIFLARIFLFEQLVRQCEEYIISMKCRKSNVWKYFIGCEFQLQVLKSESLSLLKLEDFENHLLECAQIYTKMSNLPVDLEILHDRYNELKHGSDA